MDDKFFLGLVAAASAIAGGAISSIAGPWFKHRLEETSRAKRRKRAQIAIWRKMLLEVHHAAGGNINPNEYLNRHPQFLTLEPYLSEAGRRVTRGRNWRIVIDQELSYPLETLKHEIARIEREWEVGK